MDTEIHINTAEIPPEGRYQHGKSCIEMYLRFIAQPGSREMLDAVKEKMKGERK